MNRDMDVIRQIVLASRDAPGPLHGVDGIEESVFAFNVMLLEEAGLAKALVNLDSDSPNPEPINAVLWRLTWQGFDFADAVADDTLWNKAKEHVIKPAASWSFGVLLEYLKFEAKQRLGIEQAS